MATVTKEFVVGGQGSPPGDASSAPSILAPGGDATVVGLDDDCGKWERRCQALLAVVPDLVLRLRRDGMYLDYRPSRQFPAVYSPEQVAGHTVREVLPPDVARQRMAAIEQALVMGCVQELRYELTTGGTRRLREERVAPSGPDEVIVLVRDVTERQRAEQAVRDLQHELESLFEHVPDLVATLAADGTLLFVNHAASEASRRAVVGTNIYEHLAPSEQAAAREAIRRVLSTGRSSTFDAATLGSLGPAASYECRLGAVMRDGRVAALTLVASDITERERVLEALRDSEERYRGLVEGSRDAIFITMRDGRIADFNQAALDLFGYTRDEVARANVSELYVDPADRDRFRAAIEECGSVRDYEVRLRRKDRSRFIGLLTATIRRAKDGTIAGYQGILRDVTERRRLERELLASSEREQQRIGQDLHDGLGQHLMGVSFLSKVLSDKLAAQGLAEARDAARIESLVGEAIKQTRQLAKGLQPVALDNGGLGTALQEMCGQVADLFGVPCTCHVLDEPVLGDGGLATHVYYIAREAIHNAVKHSKPRAVGVELCTVGGDGILSVRDDGIGFELCDRRSRGLGLNIMSYRAQMIGGALEVKSEPGSGTLVVCVFPVTAAAAREGNRERERAR